VPLDQSTQMYRLTSSALLERESTDVFDQRDRDVGQHGHLEQPDEGVSGHAQECAGLPESEAAGQAESEADQDLAGQRLRGRPVQQGRFRRGFTWNAAIGSPG
jgi:hypothetical protein